MPLRVACINVDKKELASGKNLAQLFANQQVDLGIVLEPGKALWWEKRNTEFGEGQDQYTTEVIHSGGLGQQERVVFFCGPKLKVISGDDPGYGNVDISPFPQLAQFRSPAWIHVRKARKAYMIAGFHAPCSDFDGNATVAMSLLTKKDGALERAGIDVLLADTNQSAMAEISWEPARGQAYATRLLVASIATKKQPKPGFYERILALPAIKRFEKSTWSTPIPTMNHQLIGIELS